VLPHSVLKMHQLIVQHSVSLLLAMANFKDRKNPIEIAALRNFEFVCNMLLIS
jgi:hypothetical protein